MKELYLCKSCKSEFWFEFKDWNKEDHICPNKCDKYKSVCLGQNDDEINKRRELFSKDAFDYEIVDDGYYNEEYSGNKTGKSNSLGLTLEEESSGFL